MVLCFFSLLPSWELTYPILKVLLKMIFLFPRWDMLIPWWVVTMTRLKSKSNSLHSSCNDVSKTPCAAEPWMTVAMPWRSCGFRNWSLKNWEMGDFRGQNEFFSARIDLMWFQRVQTSWFMWFYFNFGDWNLIPISLVHGNQRRNPTKRPAISMISQAPRQVQLVQIQAVSPSTRSTSQWKFNGDPQQMGRPYHSHKGGGPNVLVGPWKDHWRPGCMEDRSAGVCFCSCMVGPKNHRYKWGEWNNTV